jgi:hypothetical protein
MTSPTGRDEKRKPCANGHVWSNQFGDDWMPDRGTPCDCGQKQWGITPTGRGVER